MLRNRSQVGGNAFFVNDSCVWAEIYYLDSPTDYREYLAQYASIPKLDSELLILDSCSKGVLNARLILAGSLAIILCTAVFFLVYLSF
jgi:hypothetical protein